MNKNERRYFNTALLFDEALISLLEKKDIEYITIKEICSKADVNRSTFYLHYENINDLVEEAYGYVGRKFIGCYDDTLIDFKDRIKSSPLEELYLIEKKYLIPYLAFIRDNQKVFRAAFNNPAGMKTAARYDHLKEYILLPILDRFNVDKPRKDYLLAFYINGIMAIIKEWIKKGCREDIDTIGDIIIKCVGV